MSTFLQVQDEPPPERFSSDWWTEVLFDKPVQLVGLVVIAIILRYILHRVITRIVARTSEKEPPTRMFGSTTAARIVFGSAGGYSERRALRVQTMGSLLSSVVTIIIGAIVVVMALDILGYPIGPLLASAGIAGVALGFGAQNLVKDFLAGIAMLLEDQYGVGDVIDMGEATGIVESVSLRVTRLRAVDGTVWYVRNGEVMRIGNSSQDWARAVIDVGVAYQSDTATVRRVLEEVSHELADDEHWSDLILEEPEVWGVESLAADRVVVRVVIKTRPLEQWKVARELRERIKHRFDADGIEIPFPQRSLWIRNDGSSVAADHDEEPSGTAQAPAGAPGDRRDDRGAGDSEPDAGDEATPDTAEEQRRKATRAPEPEA